MFVGVGGGGEKAPHQGGYLCRIFKDNYRGCRQRLIVPGATDYRGGAARDPKCCGSKCFGDLHGRLLRGDPRGIRGGFEGDPGGSGGIRGGQLKITEVSDKRRAQNTE